jgi:hypothetical protein
MASVRVITNQTVPITATSNNYITFKMPAGNISSISMVLRGTLSANTKKFSAFDGANAAFGRVKITFDGQVVFDQTQFDATDTTNSYQQIDVLRTVLNGSGMKGVQQQKARINASTTAVHAETHFPLMLTTGKEVNVNVIYDSNVSTSYSDDDAFALVADVMINYVDNLSGTYATRQLSREINLSNTGTSVKQIPTVDGYALEAIYMLSTEAGVATEQFGDGSRISLRDLNGNVFLGERSGTEYGMVAQDKWGGVPKIAEDRATISTPVHVYPMDHLAGKIILDARQMVGSAALYLTPSANNIDALDIYCIYVRRNSANATAAQARQLTTTADSIGDGVVEKPAIV